MSSTAWTEKVGFVAAISTIDFFVKKKVNLHLDNLGRKIKINWLNLSKKYNLNLKVSETNALCTFFFDYPNSDELYTLFSKIMLKNKILASNSVYISYAHKNKHINKYLKVCEKAFKYIR